MSTNPRTKAPFLRNRLENLCDAAQRNHCPNDPPCTGDDPLDIDDWCGVCLLVTDIRRTLESYNG